MPPQEAARTTELTARLRSAGLADDAFAHLFEALHEGVYIGLVGRDETATLAANPHLRLMFGWAPDAPRPSIRPFEPDRFVDEQARVDFLQQLSRDGQVHAYLLRLRRADGSAMWVEVTARAERLPAAETLRVEARDARRHRAEEASGSVARPVPSAVAGRKARGAGPDDVRRRARAEQPARDDPGLRRAAGRPPARRADPPRSRRHPQRRRARRAHRPQPADVRAQAAHDAHDRRPELRSSARRWRSAPTNSAPPTSSILEALAAGLPPVFADPHQIQQILLNLIINAEQAMLDAHGRGTLILRSWHDPDRDAVVLEVNDDGPGVPEDVQTKIFDPFFTTKAVGKGTGLGLTVAYAIAQEHGGRSVGRVTPKDAARRSFSSCRSAARTCACRTRRRRSRCRPCRRARACW